MTREDSIETAQALLRLAESLESADDVSMRIAGQRVADIVSAQLWNYATDVPGLFTSHVNGKAADVEATP